MRAVVIRTAGGPEVLELREVAEPQPGHAQIRVRVRATAVNRADLLQRRGRYPAPHGSPADIPGLEYAGTVDALGDGVRLWRPGERVMGLVGGGGYAEAVVVHEREAVAIPENLSFEEAAAVPEAFITAHDALFTRVRLAPGERVLIHAVGSGVGTAALQLARAAGATVLGTARTKEKLERARALGLDVGIDASTADFSEVVLHETGGRGAQAIVDLVGGAYLPGNLRALATLGRIVVLGTVAGPAAELDLRLLLGKRATIIGTVLRSRALEEKIAAVRLFEDQVVPLLAMQKVRPVVDRVLRVEQAADAHRCVEANENFGKVVIAL